MGTLYPAYHQDPLGDDMPAYDTYAPAPDVNFMSQDHSGMNIYNTLPQSHRGQWWSTKDAFFAKPTSMTTPNFFAQEEPRYNYTYDPETSTQWDSSATSTHSYPVPSPAIDLTNLEIPVGDTESRRGTSSTDSDKRKRKRSTTKPTASKSTRRVSTKAIKQEAAPPKSKSRRSKAKPASQPTSYPLSDDELAKYSKKIQERNRIASNKFRVKKREDAKKLQADKENMEQTNHKLLSSVSDLTQQVYELKTKLLQHNDCDCHLIQEYIANEANRYICDLGDMKQQTTAPLSPRYLHRYQ
ncbi:hypothetical protein FOCG_17660 [Fusarium oxysporum f. sp. radicis-lycopersici 26381]|nr:hypothetical protein FOCG_17660 [Fusarium oxysporum f. sp. radicis-lycopersici 26381]